MNLNECNNLSTLLFKIKLSYFQLSSLLPPKLSKSFPTLPFVCHFSVALSRTSWGPDTVFFREPTPPAVFLCFLNLFLFMIQSKIKPIKPFIYMKSGRLFRHSMWSEEADIQARIHFSWLQWDISFLGIGKLQWAKMLRIQNEIFLWTWCLV